MLNVREPFHLNGVMVSRGTLLSGADEAFVRESPELMRRCAQVSPAEPTEEQS